MSPPTMLTTSSTAREGLLPADTPLSTAPPPPVYSIAGERGLAQLAETQRIAADTERLGMGVLGQLSDQRGQLENAIEQRRDAHETLSVSSRLIRQMHRRAAWTKVSLCLIISFLIAAVMVIVYLKWLSPSHPPSPPPPSPSPTFYGRMLQDVSPPPATAAAVVASRPLGTGIIILIVLGVLSLLTCVWAYPRGLVVRTLTVCLVTLCYAIIAIALLTIPREDADDDSGKVTDSSTILRILLLCISLLACLLSLACVLVVHVVAVKKAPVVKEPEPVEAYRLAP